MEGRYTTWRDSFGKMLKGYLQESIYPGDEVFVVSVFPWKDKRWAVVKRVDSEGRISRSGGLVEASDVSVKRTPPDSVPYKAVLFTPASFGSRFGGGPDTKPFTQEVEVLTTYNDYWPVAVVAYNDKIERVRQDRLRRLRSREEVREDAPKKVRQQQKRRHAPETPQQALLVLNRLGIYDPRADTESVRQSIIKCIASTPRSVLPSLFKLNAQLEPTNLLTDFYIDVSYDNAVLSAIEDKMRTVNRTALVTFMESLDVDGVARVLERVLQNMNSEDASKLVQCLRYNIEVNPSYVLAQRTGEWDRQVRTTPATENDGGDDLSWLEDIEDE